ncbi:MAG TPA: glucosamine-6-phosphate deaminase [Solirubrobacteraceae bacterium]|nr:glucosamine-6-phosphate deaminase [Solirubrobacteraceae bacterium]
MKLRIVEDYEALSFVAAAIVADEIERQGPLVLLPATGSTPIGAYQQLAQRHAARELDSSQITLVQLDEYVDIAPDDRRSLFGWMKRLLIDPLKIPSNCVLPLDGYQADLALSCHRYDQSVRASGGLNLAILGLGPNGHLGFNEPPAGPSAPTRVVQLSPASIESNARYWGSRSLVPTRALTAGMDIILSAQKILLLVSGSHKAEVLRRTLAGKMTDELPASYLRLAPDVTVIADRPAWPWGDGGAHLVDDIAISW